MFCRIPTMCVRISEQLPRDRLGHRWLYFTPLSRSLFFSILVPEYYLPCISMHISNTNEYAHWHVGAILHFAVKCPGLLLVILVPRQLPIIPRSIVCRPVKVYQPLPVNRILFVACHYLEVTSCIRVSTPQRRGYSTESKLRTACLRTYPC